jgi:hypothetical protein
MARPSRTRRRRRLSYAEAAFFAVQIPPVLFWLPEQYQIKYLQFISIYAVIRTAIAGAQADSD